MIKPDALLLQLLGACPQETMTSKLHVHALCEICGLRRTWAGELKKAPLNVSEHSQGYVSNSGRK